MPEQVSFNINELTEGTVAGTGVFDVLMQAVKAHLKGEFEAGRIRGTDYANAYTMSVGQVLAQASQYATQRAKLEAELKLLEAQTLQVQQETQTSAAQAGLLAAQTSLITKQELQTVQETKNLVSQELQTKAQTAISNYQLECILPKEANNLLLAGILTGAQTSAAVQQTNNMIEQHKGIKVDNEMKKFQMDFLLPNELEIKESQLAIAEKEVLIKGEQLLITKFELENKLPADVGLITAQDELYTQKTITEKAQTDESVVGAGSVIDTNNKLLEEQSKVYLRNAQQTAAKLLIDTWNVRHSSDPDGNLENAANKLQDADIGAAITRMNANLS